MQIQRIDKAERTDKEELDEEALVDAVKPLLECSTTILQETYGAIKALDPNGKIANNAQNRAKNSEASAEEQHLAQGLSTLAGEVTKTIQHAKDVIKDMPHAKNKLGPLLDLLGGEFLIQALLDTDTDNLRRAVVSDPLCCRSAPERCPYASRQLGMPLLRTSCRIVLTCA